MSSKQVNQQTSNKQTKTKSQSKQYFVITATAQWNDCNLIELSAVSA